MLSFRPVGFVSSKVRSGVPSKPFRISDTQNPSQGVRRVSRAPSSTKVENKYEYLGLLTNRNKETVQEIKNLEKKIGKCNADQKDYLCISERNENLTSTINELEDENDDCQMLISILQQGIDPNTLYTKYNLLKAKNDKETERANAIFMKRAEVDEQISKLQSKNEVMKEAVESMCPAKQKEYYSMTITNKELLKKVGVLKARLERLLKKKEEYESELATDEDKREMLALYKELKSKTEELKALKTPEPQRTEDLEKTIEEDSNEVEGVEKQLAVLRQKEKKIKERDRQSQEAQMAFDKIKKREEKLDQLLATVERKAAKQKAISHAHEKVESYSSLVNTQVRNGSMDPKVGSRVKKLMKLVVEESQQEGGGKGLNPEMKLLVQDLKMVQTSSRKLRSDLNHLKEQAKKVESVLATLKPRRRSKGQSDKNQEKEQLLDRQSHFKQELQELNHKLNRQRRELRETEEKSLTLQVLNQISHCRSSSSEQKPKTTRAK